MSQTSDRLHRQVEALRRQMDERMRDEDVSFEDMAALFAGICDAQAQEIEALRREKSALNAQLMRERGFTGFLEAKYSQPEA